MVAHKAPVRRQRQNEPPTLRQPVEPDVSGAGRAGVDIDDIGSVERHDRPVPADDLDIGTWRQVDTGTRRQLRIELDRRHPTRFPYQMRHNGGVVAGAGTDMYGVVPL